MIVGFVRYAWLSTDQATSVTPRVVMVVMSVAIWRQLSAEYRSRVRADRRRRTQKLTESASRRLASESTADPGGGAGEPTPAPAPGRRGRKGGGRTVRAPAESDARRGRSRVRRTSACGHDGVVTASPRTPDPRDPDPDTPDPDTPDPRTPDRDELVERLRGVVGGAHVLTDPAVTASYLTDWTGRFRGRAACVVQPAGTREVAGVLATCAAAGTPVVVQGGNTGLVGGATPMAGEVLLSLVRLTDLGPVDRVSGQVVAGAGVRLAVLQQHARAAGTEFGVDIGARGSATLGGLAATNAGGNQVMRYGTTRAQVLGLEAVLPDGAVVSRMAGLPKDNTGYDLVSLFAGSEGTLGVITKLRLRLWPPAPARAVALIGLPGTAACLALAQVLRERVSSLTAMELFHRDGMELVRSHADLPYPLPGPPDAALLLVECAGRADPTEELLAALAAAGADNAAIGTDSRTRERLWAYRERIPEALNATGTVVKLDVAVPLDSLVEAAAEISAAAGRAAPGARAVLFGHLNEGNLHVNVVGAEGREAALTAQVLEVVAAHGGSISAEHGIGRAKPRFLPLTRTAADIAVMRRVKRAFDPHGLLNPGVIFDSRAAPAPGP